MYGINSIIANIHIIIENMYTYVHIATHICTHCNMYTQVHIAMCVTHICTHCNMYTCVYTHMYILYTYINKFYTE